jgi:protein TonB
MTEVLPETLPGDFVEWDEACQSAKPAQPACREPDTGVGVVSNPAAQVEEHHCAAAPPGQAVVASVDKLRFSAPRPNGATATAKMRALDEIPRHSLWANAVETIRVTRRRWPIVLGASVAPVVILAALIPMFDHGNVPSVRPVAAPAPTMSESQQSEDAAPARAHSTVTVPKSTAAATTAGEAQTSSEATSRPGQKNARLSPDPPMMYDQLHTPTRLRIKANLAEQASPPSGGFVATDIHGLDNTNAIGAVFGSPKRPRVQIASQQVVSPRESREQIESRQVITVPPNVALDLLIQKRPPAYPSIAKTAKVSGTIVLAATISKTGNVEDLRVVSGPYMLRTSSVDAVRDWRFKPYMLNGQPMAIETTINLHFSLN